MAEAEAAWASPWGEEAAAGEPSVVVSADGAALHGWVVHVIDLAKQQGITKFAINVQAGE